MISRRSQPWTEADDDALRRQAAAGLTAADIAAALGRPLRSVRYRLRKGCRAPFDAGEVTKDDRALLCSAAFDSRGWVLPDATTAVVTRLDRAGLIEHRRGQWYLRSRAFAQRLKGSRTEPGETARRP